MAMGGHNDNRGTMSEINVTPLVDVMLVLLIIFMVTAPMMQQGVQVNLPKAATKAMNPAGDLRSKLTDLFAARTKKEVFLKADASVPYGEVVRIMADIKGAGIERLGMVTEPAPK